jgi:Flp pilus assembly protein TadG
MLLSNAAAFHNDESGSEQIEFALSSTLLLTVIFGILACCQTLYANHFVAHAAREATRYAMVRGSTWQGTTCASTTSFSCVASTNDVKNFVVSVTPLGFQASNLSVATSWPGTTPLGAGCASTNGNNSPGCIVVVKVTYTYDYVLPFVPHTSLAMISTSSFPISQ